MKVGGMQMLEKNKLEVLKWGGDGDGGDGDGDGEGEEGLYQKGCKPCNQINFLKPSTFLVKKMRKPKLTITSVYKTLS